MSLVTDRVASRLIEAIEHDDAQRSAAAHAGARRSPTDERRQQLLVGAWIGDEIATVNEERLHRGERPLSISHEQNVRARVVADLTGAGPLEPFISDPDVEEIDVNGPDSTWVTYTDGRKVDVGSLWTSAAELTAFQKRMALRMTGTGEGRLDTSSPMLTLQSRDGARIVMVLGGSGEHGVSTHPAPGDPSLRGPPGRPRRARRSGPVPAHPRRAVARPRAVRIHDPGVGAARGRQDHVAHRTARRGVAARAHHHRGEEPARTATRGRPAASRCTGAVHPSRQLRGRRRDHDSPIGGADAAPQPRPRGGGRTRRGRGARHARRGVDVQTRIARDHPRPHRRHRPAASGVLRVEVEHEPARVRRVDA